MNRFGGNIVKKNRRQASDLEGALPGKITYIQNDVFFVSHHDIRKRQYPHPDPPQILGRAKKLLLPIPGLLRWRGRLEGALPGKNLFPGK